MKKKSQVEILHWAKTKHKVDPKYIHKSLKDKDFDTLCSLLYKNRQIGDVVSTKEIVNEFISEHGIQFIPNSFNGIDVDLNFFFNTHPLNEDGSVDVDLYHLLLHSWCKPNRSNYRTLKSHLKSLEYKVVTFKPNYTTRSDNSFVNLKREYPLSLPKNLVRYVKPIKWYKSIVSWLYLNSPKITLKDESYNLKEIGSRWEAYFTQRFIELFTMSEIEFLYQHPQIRGCYENAPPVLALCEMTIRDVFKPTSLRDWIKVVLQKTELNLNDDDEHFHIFLDTVYDEISGKLSKTMIKGRPIRTFKSVEGWISIIVISYINDTLRSYTELI
jgi:hypothetical protein